MTKEASSIKPKEESGTPDRFPLEVTPGKLVVPSSGILDVKIKNTTDMPLNIVFELNSFSFDVDLVYMENEKEIIKPFWWGEKKIVECTKRMTPEHICGYEVEKMTGTRKESLHLDSNHVFHLKITCNGREEEIKNTLTFDKSHELGYLHIKCSYHIESVRPNPGDTKYASGFHLDSSRYFLLSIDPECEKAKELAERFSEHLKQHVRKDRVITCSFEEDKNWMTEELNLDCYTDNPKKREQMEKWNKEILTKYGPKLDQLSNYELRKIKEGYRDPNGEAKKLELKEKQAEEQLKKDIAAQNERNERKLSTRIKKKCMIM